MANSTRNSSGLWVWVVIALLVAVIVVATIYYIGWFDNNTHVDTPAGDNVTEQYEISGPGADTPGEADWQNASGESLDEVITNPEVETATPPEGEK